MCDIPAAWMYEPGELDMIVTKDLTKEYGAFRGKGFLAVNKINFEVNDKDIFGFLGPNGAGKTTTINMLISVLEPTSGTAEIGGYDIIKSPLLAKRKLGIMPEMPMFYDWLSAEDQLKFYCEFYGYGRHECRKRARELIELVGLSSFGKHKIKTFSHGMRKRLALAQALVNDPELLILDEPMGGLDPMGVKAFREMIKELNKNDITIFLSSHILSEIQQICNRVGIINHGRILAVDTISNLSMHFTKETQKKLYVEGKELSTESLESIRTIKGTLNVEPAGVSGGFYITVDETIDTVDYSEDVNRTLAKNNIFLSRLEVPQPNLEDLFMSITSEDDK